MSPGGGVGSPHGTSRGHRSLIGRGAGSSDSFCDRSRILPDEITARKEEAGF